MVTEGCFRLGLYRQGLLHDLSKYMPSEFIVGAKYYRGVESPNNAERRDKGYSSAWLHHKGRNKHHYEYWMDYDSRSGKGIVPARMPLRYVLEMFVDRIAASKIYNGDNYTDDMPLEYYKSGNPGVYMHDDSKRLLEGLLKMLAVKGEAYTMRYIKKRLVPKIRLEEARNRKHFNNRQAQK